MDFCLFLSSTNLLHNLPLSFFLCTCLHQCNFLISNVWTNNYCLMIEKDICDCRNISVKLQWVSSSLSYFYFYICYVWFQLQNWNFYKGFCFIFLVRLSLADLSNWFLIRPLSIRLFVSDILMFILNFSQFYKSAYWYN